MTLAEVSKNPSPSAVSDHDSWLIAERRPSRSAPRRIRWIVSVRWVATWNSCCRVSATFTGRWITFEARIASVASGWTCSFEPKPPPM